MGKRGKAFTVFYCSVSEKKEIELNEYEDAFRPFFFSLQAKKCAVVEVCELPIVFCFA
jgi:hypothetical protein